MTSIHVSGHLKVHDLCGKIGRSFGSFSDKGVLGRSTVEGQCYVWGLPLVIGL